LSNKAVFLDRDGVINKSIIVDGKPYPPKNYDEFEILPGVKKALLMLKKAGFLLIVVTNQPDVGDKKQKKEIVESFHEYLLKNFPIDFIEVCYDRNSSCYKPKTKLFENAANKFNINFSKSYMIGDRWRDIEAGKNVGCITFFIDYGYKEKLYSNPDFISLSLYEAAKEILNIKKMRRLNENAKRFKYKNFC